MNCDLHVHTKFSCDSDALVSGYCQRALKNNVQCICFTDHIDCNPCDYGYGYYDIRGYFDEINRAKEKYGDKLTILCGIEFSEPHIYSAEFERYQKQPYDFIIGSIHYWIDNLFPSEMIKHHIPIEVCYEAYWQEVLKAVSYGGFDCLGHLDFPKRYYHQLVYDKDLISEIFDRMIKNNILLEINTSSLRKGLTETLPGGELLKLYQTAGGKFVTMGSDAHFIQDLYAGFEQMKSLVHDLNLKEVYFKQRKMCFISEAW